MRRIFTRILVFATLLMVTNLSALAQNLEDFYKYSKWDTDMYQIKLTDAFKAEFEKAEGGVFKSGSYTWRTGDPLLNPAPDNGKYNGNEVVSMSGLFSGCEEITQIDLTYFDTRYVKDMQQMFKDCSALKTIKWTPKFNTVKVENMSAMFEKCKAITTLDLSDFKTSNVTNMSRMFYGCEGLTTLNVSSFNTKSLTNMHEMFTYCQSLSELDLSNFNTTNVTSMSKMFANCKSLTAIDLSSFNTENATNMSQMFDCCFSLSTLDVSNFNTTEVVDMSYMFNLCTALTALDVTNFNTENVRDMSGMFYDCRAITELDLSTFNTQNVTKMKKMFADCKSLTDAEVSNFTTDKVTDMSSMFEGCSSLTSLNILNFNTSNVLDMSSMFRFCTSLEKLHIRNFNTPKVQNMDEMFSYCYKLASFDMSGFTISKSASIKDMFKECGAYSCIATVKDQETKTTLDNAVTGVGNVRFVAQETKALDPRSHELSIKAGDMVDVTLLRRFFKSWTTLNLPFDMSKEKIEEVFGEGTKIAAYTGRISGKILIFNTVDSIEAMKPYLILPTKIVYEPVIKNVIYKSVLDNRIVKGETVDSIEGAENCRVNMYSSIVARSNDLNSVSKYNSTINDTTYTVYAVKSTSTDFGFIDAEKYSNPYSKVMGTNCYFAFTSDYEPLDPSKFTVSIADVELDPAATEFKLAKKNGADVRLLRSFTADEWTTLCLPFNVSKDQIEDIFGEGTKVAKSTTYNASENTLHFTSCDSMKEGEPYLIKPKNVVIDPIFENVDITLYNSYSSIGTGRFVTGAQSLNKATLMGFYNTTAKGLSSAKFVSRFDSEGKLYIDDSDLNVYGTEAVWLTTVDNEEIALPTVIINGVKADVQLNHASPVSEGGAKGTFNLKGQRVSNPQHGFYIIDGKKAYIGK